MEPPAFPRSTESEGPSPSFLPGSAHHHHRSISCWHYLSVALASPETPPSVGGGLTAASAADRAWPTPLAHQISEAEAGTLHQCPHCVPI